MQDVALDACCLINLCAAGTILSPLLVVNRQVPSRRNGAQECPIGPGFGLSLHVPAKVTREALYIMQPDEEDQTILVECPIDLQPYVAAGLLAPCDLETHEEIELFVQMAAQLGDGEAACFALAAKRGWTLATDDRRAGDLRPNPSHSHHDPRSWSSSGPRLLAPMTRRSELRCRTFSDSHTSLRAETRPSTSGGKAVWRGRKGRQGSDHRRSGDKQPGRDRSADEDRSRQAPAGPQSRQRIRRRLMRPRGLLIAEQLQADGSFQDFAGFDQAAGAVVVAAVIGQAGAAVEVEHLEVDLVRPDGRADVLRAVGKHLDALAFFVGQAGRVDMSFRAAEIVAAPDVVVQAVGPVAGGTVCGTAGWATASPCGRPMWSSG